LTTIILAVTIITCIVSLLPPTNILKRWAQPLVEEYAAPNTMPIKRTPVLPMALMTVTILGAAIEIAQLALAPEWVWDVLCLCGWVWLSSKLQTNADDAKQLVVLTFLLYVKPRECPYYLLMFYTPMLVLQVLFVLSFSHVDRSTSVVLHEFSVAIVLSANAIILLMPFRPAALGLSDIAPVGAPPTHEMRSPEDNLKLYQFLYITWMEPMIISGKTKQMEDGDVWTLAYQFQHRRLFDSFKHVKGTLITRLLKAYGVECVCICILALAELVCGKICHSPIL
jgi:hypothetical protein